MDRKRRKKTSKRRAQRRRTKTKSRQTSPNPLAPVLHLCEQGRLEEAESLCKRLVEDRPQRSDTCHLLGLISYRQGKEREAVHWMHRALACAPDDAAIQIDLGNVLHELGRLDDAESAFRSAIAVQPESGTAHNNLGVVLKDQGRFEQAVAAFQTAIQRDPADSGAYLNLAAVLHRQGRVDDAMDWLRRAISTSPCADAFRKLVALLRGLGRYGEAGTVITQWLQHDPDDAIALHMHAAHTGNNVPARASQEYVKQLFDDFAAEFDRELAALDYRGPQLIATALAEQCPEPAHDLSVLDAGCGTGLCGPPLRPYARHLAGVDLSPAMLARARTRACYDALFESDLIHFLERRPDSFDLVVAADTINYFGRLEPVLADAAVSLREEGLVIFTLEESAKAAPSPFRLALHGRYTHTRDYVRRCIVLAELDLCSMTDAPLRTERGAPVPTLVVCARKRKAV